MDVDDGALAELHERLLVDAAGEPSMQSEQARLVRLLAAELAAEAAEADLSEAQAAVQQSDRSDRSDRSESALDAALRGPCPPFHRAYPLRGRGERRFWRSRPFGHHLLFPAPRVMCVPRRLVWRVERIRARGERGPWGNGRSGAQPIPTLIDEEIDLSQPQPQPQQLGADDPALHDAGVISIAGGMESDAEMGELEEAAGHATWRQWLDGGAADAQWEVRSEL